MQQPDLFAPNPELNTTLKVTFKPETIEFLTRLGQASDKTPEQLVRDITVMVVGKMIAEMLAAQMEKEEKEKPRLILP